MEAWGRGAIINRVVRARVATEGGWAGTEIVDSGARNSGGRVGIDQIDAGPIVLTRCIYAGINHVLLTPVTTPGRAAQAKEGLGGINAYTLMLARRFEACVN